MTRPDSAGIGDGGAAFPAPFGEEAWMVGMSLRDYFAAKALQGLVAGVTQVDVTGIIRHAPRDVAEIAYVYADAMLAARGAK